VAAAMGAVGAANKITEVFGVGDNFYEDGISCSGDHSPGCTADARSHRFVDTFENVYNAPSLQVPWYFNAGKQVFNPQFTPHQRAPTNPFASSFAAATTGTLSLTRRPSSPTPSARAARRFAGISPT